MGLSLTGADVESFINLMRPSVAAYNVVDSIPDNLPAVKYPRTRDIVRRGTRTGTMPGTSKPWSKARPTES